MAEPRLFQSMAGITLLVALVMVEMSGNPSDSIVLADDEAISDT